MKKASLVIIVATVGLLAASSASAICQKCVMRMQQRFPDDVMCLVSDQGPMADCWEVITRYDPSGNPISNECDGTLSNPGECGFSGGGFGGGGAGGGGCIYDGGYCPPSCSACAGGDGGGGSKY